MSNIQNLRRESFKRHVDSGPGIRSIEALDLAARLRERNEVAVLDVRELGRHSEDGHILLSVPLPLSVLETRIPLLVPRKATPIVVYDGGEGLAEKAAERLLAGGYEDVSILANGMAGWRDSGLEVYTGVNVLSKAFGEFVEHAYGTPRLSVPDLKQKLDAGEDLVIFDGRTLEEFETFSIPGAYACPNAELPYRVHDLIPSEDTLVVINCAGRTRSIIGAQALINARLPNRVVSLENGAMAWLKEGYKLNTGHRNAAPVPSEDARGKARRSAARLRERFAIRSVDRATLDATLADNSRTTYLLDVRTRAEYESGHLPGSVWAEGGQLVQATDQWIGTRHGRIVLVDDADGVRAATTASWLIQLGWEEVVTYAIDAGADVLETGPQRSLVLGQLPSAVTISGTDLKTGLDAGNLVLFDFSNSKEYRAQHIPGARFAIRSQIDERLLAAAKGGGVAVTAGDREIALLAAQDIAGLGLDVRVLDGGIAAWRGAGLPVAGEEDSIWHDQPTDVWLSSYHRKDRFAAFDAYIAWEIGLIDQLKRDTTVSFRKFSQ